MKLGVVYMPVPGFANERWDTMAKGPDGKPLWPDGKYSVNVYAWDIAGNQEVAGTVVEVKNQAQQTEVCSLFRRRFGRDILWARSEQ